MFMCPSTVRYDADKVDRKKPGMPAPRAIGMGDARDPAGSLLRCLQTS
jgi:hypothetical protein